MKFKLTVEYEARDEYDAETLAQEITQTLYDIPTSYRTMSGRNEDKEEANMYYLLGKTIEVTGPEKAGK
jgi:hypothetical protein